MATTSGTVSTYPYNQRKVIDHAARRAGIAPQDLTSEDLQVATDNILSLTSEWINAGYPLWTRQYGFLSAAVGSPEVVLPVGTNDVFNVFWRIFNPWRQGGTTSGNADASTLFSGQPGLDIVVPSPNPSITVNFGSAALVETVGVLLGNQATFTAALQIETSSDGVTFAVSQTLPSSTYTKGAWVYFDMDPTINAQYLRIVYPGAQTWTLQQLLIGFAESQEIQMGFLSIDDYYNLTDKQYQGNQPNSCFIDRPIGPPVVKIWPTLNTEGFYMGAVTALSRRYIQDPGQLYNNVEVPQRWLEALQWRLAVNLFWEIPAKDMGGSSSNPYASISKQQERQARIQKLEQAATKSEALAWAEERTRGPIRFLPNLRRYTS